ncbi:MAG: SUMF1/EgtB/PvdO family nonheme iron enzyme, partial [Myxococcota bacterium]|nr:SUMF1/EgtB/PvdO family nonheme iron enzyme [Myxococcota bacterium]
GKKENGYGLCDMSGNVWEWVWDISGAYESGSVSNPTGKTSGTKRVLRGGSWRRSARNARVSTRSSYHASYWGGDLGFRLVRSN